MLNCNIYQVAFKHFVSVESESPTGRGAGDLVRGV
jgi:hypothetical protein